MEEQPNRSTSGAPGAQPSDRVPAVLLNRAAIEAAIPHRDPFLFLDAVVERTDDALSATWRVPEDGPWFRGHFPGRPILPGVLISEHAFQAAAVLIALALGGFRAEDGVPVLTKIEAARFRRMVRPGDVLTTRVRVLERVGPAWVLDAHVACEGATVVKLRCTLSASGALARAAEGL